MMDVEADEEGLRMGRKAWMQVTAPLTFVFVEDVSGTGWVRNIMSMCGDMRGLTREVWKLCKAKES